MQTDNKRLSDPDVVLSDAEQRRKRYEDKVAGVLERFRSEDEFWADWDLRAQAVLDKGRSGAIPMHEATAEVARMLADTHLFEQVVSGLPYHLDHQSYIDLLHRIQQFTLERLVNPHASAAFDPMSPRYRHSSVAAWARGLSRSAIRSEFRNLRHEEQRGVVRIEALAVDDAALLADTPPPDARARHIADTFEDACHNQRSTGRTQLEAGALSALLDLPEMWRPSMVERDLMKGLLQDDSNLAFDSLVEWLRRARGTGSRDRRHQVEDLLPLWDDFTHDQAENLLNYGDASTRRLAVHLIAYAAVADAPRPDQRTIARFTSAVVRQSKVRHSDWAEVAASLASAFVESECEAVSQYSNRVTAESEERHRSLRARFDADVERALHFLDDLRTRDDVIESLRRLARSTGVLTTSADFVEEVRA